MKTITPLTLKKAKWNHLVLPLIVVIAALMILPSTSCRVGNDGRPGLAYIAFDWVDSEPEFIDCGTPAVPPNFYYGTYYRINPGWYTGYYEGKVWNGSAYGSYAWEMDYEIWNNPGQRGGYGYNGKDGMNTYLNFVCSPIGPYLERHDSYQRKHPQGDEQKESVTKLGEETTVVYEVNEYTIRLTYRKVTPGSYTNSGNHPLNSSASHGKQ